MISEQKLLQWIENKKYVYSVGPEYFDDIEEVSMCNGARKALNQLRHALETGEFGVEEVVTK